jgi:two-component system, NtrC family, nitrogen regulation sensor histidine kinase NtrY
MKGVLAITALLILTAAAIILQIRYRGFEGPLSDNLLILILVNANFLLLAAVLFMIGRSLWKLSVERRSKVPGAKFRTKLVIAFVSLSFIPTVLLFIIGSGMYTRGMERLFSLRLENALHDSVSISQAYYDHLSGQAMGFGRQIGNLIIEGLRPAPAESDLPGPHPGPVSSLDREALRRLLTAKASEYGLGAVEVIGPDRAVLAQVVTRKFPGRTYAPAPPDQVDRALAGEPAVSVADLGKNGELVRTIVPLPAVDGSGRPAGAVAVSTFISESNAQKIEGIRSGYAEYRSSFKNKHLLKLSYRLGFLAVMLTLLLAAIWVALRVAASITVPIRSLAEGTLEVARGNLDYRVEEQSGDEVGMLVESFNRMTADLKSSGERLQQAAKNREIILETIDAGVVSMDRNGRIKTINPAACRILGVQPQDVVQRRYDDAFGFVDLTPIRSLFRRLEEGHGRAEEELALLVRGRTLALRMRISTLPGEAGSVLGSVITFDDLTELLRAKKAETWQDVARKIAHEVRNPLTPIKLSAERLRKKFMEQAPDFNQVFDESSRTIIQQVDGLKGLLDEFSEFARIPRPHPVPQRLGPIVDSVIQLYLSGAHKEVRFEKELPEGLPELLLDQEQMKRVFINLFKNAIEVMEPGGTITISVRTPDGNGMVRIEVADDGPGISTEDVSRLFDPYFSRKKKGGGLGLAIVERIIAEHNGTIHAEQNRPNGARFIMELPVNKA